MSQTSMAKLSCPDIDKYQFLNINVNTNNQILSVKGKMKENLMFWKSIGTNSKVIEIIERGYKIPFIDTPRKAHFCNSKTAFENFEFVDKSIEDLLKCGSAVETSFVPKVISPLSVSTNAKGKQRLILDLRFVNSHLYREYIRFDDWRSFEKFLVLDGFLYKFDLKSGYHHIDIFSDHQTYLGFSWRAKHYVFTVLPFGLASAAFIFTKIFRPLVAFWHSHGIKLCLYLDDGVGVEKSYNEAKRKSMFVRETLLRAGITCNNEKSVWEPTKILTWVWVSIDYERNILFIPEDRIASTLVLISTILSSPYTTARKLSRLTGKLLSMKYILGNIVRLKSRFLYRCIDERSSWDAKFNILKHIEALNEIFFWKYNLTKFNTKCIKPLFDPQEFLYSDASSIGLGAVTSGALQCHRHFSAHEQTKSSTWRELTALFYALKAFSKVLNSKTVICYVDSFAAARIVQVGSPKTELQNIALDIFQFCLENSIQVKVIWIPRAFNSAADHLSKFTDLDDWEIMPEIFEYLDSLWGPFSIDRFANEENYKVARFNSRFHCPSTEAIDAFSQNWEGENNWLVPPISNISQTIEHFSRGNTKATLFIPYWKSSVFWPLLMKENGLFHDFVKDHIIFDTAGTCLKAGRCPFAYLDPKRYKGPLIALKIEYSAFDCPEN